MGKFQDLAGQRFSRLIPLKYLSNGKWLCQCDCGNTCEVRAGHLNSGSIKSCGCLKKEYQTVKSLDGQVFGRLG